MREAKNLVDSSTPDTFRLAQTSYIYSDDGTQLAALAESEDATYLSYEDIPADVVNAFVSVEDRTFWNNSGVDYQRNPACMCQLRENKRTGGRRGKYHYPAAGAWNLSVQMQRRCHVRLRRFLLHDS